MNKNSILLLAAGALALGVGSLAALADPSAAPSRPLAANPTLVRRGEYLVTRVGLCADCHSPRDERGEFVAAKQLTGAPIPFAPTVPMPAWATVAPSIAGWPAGWSEEATVQFLMTGQRPSNLPPVRPPMPPFRMSRPDAEAVVAYLRTLK
jgi:mono/diheme cytochrome c family protein